MWTSNYTWFITGAHAQDYYRYTFYKYFTHLLVSSARCPHFLRNRLYHRTAEPKAPHNDNSYYYYKPEHKTQTRNNQMPGVFIKWPEKRICYSSSNSEPLNHTTQWCIIMKNRYPCAIIILRYIWIIQNISAIINFSVNSHTDIPIHMWLSINVMNDRCVCVSAHPQHLKLTSVSLNMTQMKQPPHRFLSHPDELQMFWEHLDLICGLMTSFIEFLKLSVFAWKQPVTYSDLLLGQIAFSVRYLIMFVIKHICSFRSLPTISGL